MLFWSGPVALCSVLFHSASIARFEAEHRPDVEKCLQMILAVRSKLQLSAAALVGGLDGITVIHVPKDTVGLLKGKNNSSILNKMDESRLHSIIKDNFWGDDRRNAPGLIRTI